MRTLLFGIAFLVWSAFSCYWYVCHIRGLCGSTEPELSEYAEEEKLPEAETIEPSFSSLDTAQIADPDPEGIRFSILYVDFAKGKDSILNVEAINPSIDEIKGVIQQSDTIIVSLVGHTDNTGTQTYNYQLGYKRASALKELMEYDGIPNDRILVLSKGETAPIASNLREEGRAKNRRVEVFLK